eukprot:TRINITY_DN21541_c0_g1_i1.p1 TRINITY_DN21541_c0_g1~~TRINITY_DN21541_c0_g1_i1.p1  ORF type:complete len:129 (-),score=36.62 TRINITY_DN21541_c0_g1_i1:764-1150(-)
MQSTLRSLLPSASSVRNSLLQRLRVPVGSQLAPVVLSQKFSADAAHLEKGKVTDRVLDVIKSFEKVDEKKVTPTAHFQTDLGLDSLDQVEVVMAFEEEFALEIPDADADKILSVPDAIHYISSHPQAK